MYTQPAQLFSAGAQLVAYIQPALRTGLMAPAWYLLHVFRRAVFVFDLTKTKGAWEMAWTARAAGFVDDRRDGPFILALPS